jgi:hypothetical protein
MGDHPVLSSAGASLSIERFWLPETMTWSDFRPGGDVDEIRADLVVRVCGKEIRFPAIHYGFSFEPHCAFSLKAVIRALVSLSEGNAHTWRESHGGMLTHLLQLLPDPAERFEFFVFDDRHLYFTYHSNQGGSLSLDVLLGVRELVATEERATQFLVSTLDARGEGGAEERSRYLGQWEHLKAVAMGLDGRLLSLPPCEEGA